MDIPAVQMDVFVVTTEITRPYEEETYHTVDSVHATEKSAQERVAEISKQNQEERGSIYGDYDHFVVNPKYKNN